METEPLKVRRPGSEKALVGWEWGDSAAPGNVEDLEILELNQYDVPEEFGVAREENTQNAWGDVKCFAAQSIHLLYLGCWTALHYLSHDQCKHGSALEISKHKIEKEKKKRRR